MSRLLTAIATILGLSAIAAACDLTTDLKPEISFFHERVERTATLTDSASVDGSFRTLRSTGVVLTPNECYSLRSNMDLRSSTITLTITGTQANTQCPATPGAYSYIFLANRLEAGTYTVKVIFSVAGRPPTTIKETSVTI